MWIVRIALQRPYTFVVLALLILLGGGFSILKTPTDIFPNIDIPVVAVVWTYTGLQPQDMSDRIVSLNERVAPTTVNDIEHTESQSLNGIAVVKYFFQPHVNENLAVSQITAISQTLLKQLPQGTTPPFVLAYNASSVPIIQLALSSPSLSESELFDYGNAFIRQALSVVSGASVPFPFGGKQRQVQVDVDPAQLRAHGLTASDLNAAIGNQNLIIPAGTQKIGPLEYFVKLNASPVKLDELNDLPVKAVNGTVIHVRDVAQVRDGSPPQTNIVRVDGHRSVLMSVLKTGNASTLDIISHIRSLLPGVQAAAPPGMEIKPLSDQSVFVRGAVSGVIREGCIAAALTGLMILLFLGSWRSTLIITISIPLSVLASIITLSLLGETINIMTLGGLALAVGILVDDATVAIENINWHLEQGKEVEQAILDGAQQIAIPALVSTFCICIAFVPMFLLSGVSRYLFVPLAESVVFAMLASYILSRTLIPTLAKYWLRKHEANHHDQADEKGNVLARLQGGFEKRFSRLRDRYYSLLAAAVGSSARFMAVFMAVVLVSFLLVPNFGPLPGLGQDFFPSADAGQLRLHMIAPTGTRIEETAALADSVEAEIRKVIPAEEITSIVDNIGLPYSGINLSYATSGVSGAADVEMFISLSEDHHSSSGYMRELRKRLNEQFPQATFAFLPADITTQILNFGLQAPLDVQVSSFNVKGARDYANLLLPKLRVIPGAADLHIQQHYDYPTLDVDVDRTRASELGLTQSSVAGNLLVALSGSFQTAPTFWLDHKTGVQYSLVTQAPQYRIQNLGDLNNLPILAGDGSTQLLANVSSYSRSFEPEIVTHYNVKPTIDIVGNLQDADLGSVSRAIQQAIEDTKDQLPKATTVVLRGQVQTMNESFHGLFLGLAGAIVLIYLLIVVNFQSWTDPFIIITALPAALAGIVWMLFLTHTTVSVPALTGAIMCMGVATANSILVVSFARERMNAGDDALTAAMAAGYTRFRPVLMTALAMIIGMVPMALGLGDGGEQNAPLGRAVIGGLLFATVATLIFVPTVFSTIHGRRARPRTDGPADRSPHSGAAHV